MITTSRKVAVVVLLYCSFVVSPSVADEEIEFPFVAAEIFAKIAAICATTSGEQNENYCDFVMQEGLIDYLPVYSENLRKVAALYMQIWCDDRCPDLERPYCPELEACRKEADDPNAVCPEAIEACMERWGAG